MRPTMHGEVIQLLMCSECDVEIPQDESPDDYHDVQVRLAGDGISIWCRRHDKLIVTLELDPAEVREHAHLSRVHGQKLN